MDEIACNKCGGLYSTRGIKTHERFCDGTLKEKKEKKEKEKKQELDLFGNPMPVHRDPLSSTVHAEAIRDENEDEPEDIDEDEEEDEEDFEPDSPYIHRDIHEDVHVQKHDFGSGIILTMCVIAVILWIALKTFSSRFERKNGISSKDASRTDYPDTVDQMAGVFGNGT